MVELIRKDKDRIPLLKEMGVVPDPSRSPVLDDKDKHVPVVVIVRHPFRMKVLFTLVTEKKNIVRGKGFPQLQTMEKIARRLNLGRKGMDLSDKVLVF